MVSRKLVEAVKLAPQRSYQIAQRAGLHPSTLSKLLNGIERVKPGDPRVVAVGSVVGVSPADCFDAHE